MVQKCSKSPVKVHHSIFALPVMTMSFLEEIYEGLVNTKSAKITLD